MFANEKTIFQGNLVPLTGNERKNIIAEKKGADTKRAFFCPIIFDCDTVNEICLLLNR